jgi:hypothetical protein
MRMKILEMNRRMKILEIEMVIGMGMSKRMKILEID